MKNAEKFQNILSNQFGKCFACCVRDAMNNATGTYGCIHPKNEYDQEKVCSMCLHESLEWLNAEYKDPILTEEEKKYITSLIQPFRQHVTFFVLGEAFEGVQRLNFFTNDNRSYCLPVYNETSMFSNVNVNEKYTLEELGL